MTNDERYDMGDFTQYADIPAKEWEKWSAALTDTTRPTPTYHEAFVAGWDAARAERDVLVARLEAVKAWQRGMMNEPWGLGGSTVSDGEYIKKCLNHLAEMLVS